MERMLAILLDLDLVGAFFTHLAWVAPLLALAIGGALAARRGDPVFYLTRALACGLTGTLLALMWLVYNRITDALGLDTVKNLLVNLGLFLAVGLLWGLLFRLLPARRQSE